MAKSVGLALLIGALFFFFRLYPAAGSARAWEAAKGARPGAGTRARIPLTQNEFLLPSPILRVGTGSAGHGRSDPAALTITETLSNTADLQVRSSGLAPVFPGETAVYTLTIKNQGPAVATQIVLTHTLAPGLTPVGTRPSQPWCDRQDRSVRCDLGDVPGQGNVISLDLSVGGNQTHVADTRLAGVTLDLATPNCTIDASQLSVICRLTQLPAGAEAPIQISARVEPQTTGLPASHAAVSATEPDPNPANNRINAAMTIAAASPLTPTPAYTTADLAIRADGPSIVTAGEPFTYTYSIQNQGEADATGVHFEDALPETANLYSYLPRPPACEQHDSLLSCTFRDPDTGALTHFNLAITGNAGQPVLVQPDQLAPGWPACRVLKERTWLHIVQCDLGTLKPGQTTHVQVGLVAIGLVERAMTNSATIRAREPDPNPRDDTITTTMSVKVRANLSLESTLSDPAVAGQPVSYTLSVANNGPSDADGVVVTDTLPAGVRFISAAPSQSDDCRLESNDTKPGSVVCHLGALARGSEATVTITLALEPATPDPAREFFHSVSVAAAQPDPDPRDNALVQFIPLGMGPKE